MGEDLNVLRNIPAREIVSPDAPVVPDTATFDELLSAALSEPAGTFFVLGRSGRYRGIVTLQGVTRLISKQESFRRAGVIVDDFTENCPAVREDETLDAVSALFARTGYDRLPVVDKDGVLVGTILFGDLFRRYNLEMTNRNIAIELGAVVHGRTERRSLRLGADTLVTEIPVPPGMAGKAIGELHLRKEYDVSVFLVKKNGGRGEPEFITPGSSYILAEGDILLVGGRSHAINRLTG
jgi:CBS domain-containing protein